MSRLGAVVVLAAMVAVATIETATPAVAATCSSGYTYSGMSRLTLPTIGSAWTVSVYTNRHSVSGLFSDHTLVGGAVINPSGTSYLEWVIVSGITQSGNVSYEIRSVRKRAADPSQTSFHESYTSANVSNTFAATRTGTSTFTLTINGGASQLGTVTIDNPSTVEVYGEDYNGDDTVCDDHFGEFTSTSISMSSVFADPPWSECNNSSSNDIAVWLSTDGNLCPPMTAPGATLLPDDKSFVKPQRGSYLP